MGQFARLSRIANGAARGFVRRCTWTTELLVTLAVVVQLSITLYLLFLNAPDLESDDMGLYNPIYMMQTTGQVTYPMQGQWDYMTVHPPLHYFVAGLVSRIWPSPLQAAGVASVVFSLIACLTCLLGRFSFDAKLAILSGLTLAVHVYTTPNTIRPELHVLFAWIAGILLLESARLDNWENKKLLLGSAVTAYAAGLHYWALAACLALPAYVVFVLIARDFRTAARKALVVAAGALIVWVPYSLLFVLPHIGQIVVMLGSASPVGGLTAAFEAHKTMLPEGAALARWGDLTSIGHIYLFPWENVGIPLIVVAVAILASSHSLRGLAIAGGMLPLFVLLMVSRKAGFWYVFPEFALYSIAVVWLLLRIIRTVLGRFRAAALSQAATSIAVIIVGLYLSPIRQFGVNTFRDDWQIARLSDKRLLGPVATVAVNQVTQWYTSGASQLLWYTHWGVGWNDMLADRASAFDALVITDDWFANQKEAIPWPQFYLEGDLSLRGFYFYAPSDRQLCGYGYLNHLDVTAKAAPPVNGHAYDRKSRILTEFKAAPDGPFVLVTLKGPLRAAGCPEALYSASFGLDSWMDPRLYALVMDRAVWTSVQDRYAKLGTIRDVVFLTVTHFSADELLRAPDPPMTFLHSPADVTQ